MKNKINMVEYIEIEFKETNSIYRKDLNEKLQYVLNDFQTRGFVRSSIYIGERYKYFYKLTNNHLDNLFNIIDKVQEKFKKVLDDKEEENVYYMVRENIESIINTFYNQSCQLEKNLGLKMSGTSISSIIKNYEDKIDNKIIRAKAINALKRNENRHKSLKAIWEILKSIKDLIPFI